MAPATDVLSLIDRMMWTSNASNLLLEKSKEIQLRDCMFICMDTNVRTTMIRAGQRADKGAAKQVKRIHLDTVRSN